MVMFMALFLQMRNVDAGSRWFCGGRPVRRSIAPGVQQKMPNPSRKHNFQCFSHRVRAI
jgi:hypothetical protein